MSGDEDMAGKAPLLKQIAWISAVPHLTVGALLVLLAYWLGLKNPILFGAAAYLTISVTLRRLIPRHHRRGIRLLKENKFDKARAEFEKSYEFFTRNAWVDDSRYLVLLSSTKICYREMALLNIAYCYGQAGDGKRSKDSYEQTLEEFPESEIAKASLRMFAAAQKAHNHDLP